MTATILEFRPRPQPDPELSAWVAEGIALNDPCLTPEFFDRAGLPEHAAEWRRQLAERAP